ncbi:Crp/Fnr family transcriptional regulator [Flavitalea antarctica]
MLDRFRKYLEDKINLTDQDFALIQSVATVKKLRKHQYLLQEGNVWKFNAFVGKGFLRTYFVDDKGTEHIMNFSPENYWTGDRESLASGAPSKYNIDAIEDSEVLLIRKDDFDSVCKAVQPFNDLMNGLLQKSFIVSQERIHVNITYSAEEKYKDFIKKYPSIANRVPLQMIASYLGLTPETITRIRRKASRK